MLVDSHCHLDYPEISERIDEVRAAMSAQQVSYALLISVRRELYDRVRAVSEPFANFWHTIGLHPEVDDGEPWDFDALCQAANHDKVVGIGETGLDYYWHKDRPEWQRARFREHIAAARATKLPLIIHTRDAAEDTLKILREENARDVGGVMHCFTESWEVARAALDLGFYISFSGIVTFKNAKSVQEVAQQVPLDRLLVETDAPYLAPVPHRGKPNEPAYVRFVAEKIAQLRGESFETVAQATTDNFFRLFSKAAR